MCVCVCVCVSVCVASFLLLFFLIFWLFSVLFLLFRGDGDGLCVLNRSRCCHSIDKTR